MKVLTERCVGCAHCMPFCRQNAIEVWGTARIIEDKCINCGVCREYCTSDAIVEG